LAVGCRRTCGGGIAADAAAEVAETPLPPVAFANDDAAPDPLEFAELLA
jgi:hypothetical protein